MLCGNIESWTKASPGDTNKILTSIWLPPSKSAVGWVCAEGLLPRCGFGQFSLFVPQFSLEDGLD